MVLTKIEKMLSREEHYVTTAREGLVALSYSLLSISIAQSLQPDLPLFHHYHI